MRSTSPRRAASASSARSVTSVPARNPRWQKTGPPKPRKPRVPNPPRGAFYGNGRWERSGWAHERAECRAHDRHPPRAADHLHDHPADDAEGDRSAASGSDSAGGAQRREPGSNRARDWPEYGDVGQQGTRVEGTSRGADEGDLRSAAVQSPVREGRWDQQVPGRDLGNGCRSRSGGEGHRRASQGRGEIAPSEPDPAGERRTNLFGSSAVLFSGSRTVQSELG